MVNLANKTALVTGASRGIGRATALVMANAGAYVLVHYGKSQSDADSLVTEIRTRGGKADAIGSDLAAPEGASELAAKVRVLAGVRLDMSLLMPVSLKLRGLRITRPLNLMIYSQRTCARPSFFCSNCSRCWEKPPA